MKRSPLYLTVPCLVGITLALAFFALMRGPQTAYASGDYDLTDNCASGVGDVPALVTAIDEANVSGASQVITLAAQCVYTLPLVNNYWYGPNALPAITGTMTIEGNGARLVITDPVRLRSF